MLERNGWFPWLSGWPGWTRRPETDPEAVREYQDRRLRQVVKHAWENVPFHRRRLEKAGLTPADIRGVADLKYIPITTKRDLLESPIEDLVARGTDLKRCICQPSSGSTGEPTTVIRSMVEERTLQLYTLRIALLTGIEPWHRHVSVKNEVKRPAWFQRLGLLPYEQVDARLAPGEILYALRRLRPDVLSGFPHALVRLAQEHARAGRRQISPIRVLSGGETLTTTAKDLIRDAFGCPVQDIYGTHECPLVAWECRMCGRYHTSDDTAITEVLAGDRPAAPGEEGTMFLTCLHSFTMPFLRFDLGDIVKRPARPAPCPVRFGQLERVVGRQRDYLPLPDGTVVAPTALAVGLRDLPGLGWFRWFRRSWTAYAFSTNRCPTPRAIWEPGSSVACPGCFPRACGSKPARWIRLP